MSSIPSDLYYSAENLWVSAPQNGLITIGLSDAGQAQIGDILQLSFPEVGSRLERGQRLATLEALKSSMDIPAPLSGQLAQLNENLLESPSLLALDVYGAGWLCKLLYEGPWPSAELMDAAAYARFLA